jgi:hypothetical protein
MGVAARSCLGVDEGDGLGMMYAFKCGVDWHDMQPQRQHVHRVRA